MLQEEQALCHTPRRAFAAVAAKLRGRFADFATAAGARPRHRRRSDIPRTWHIACIRLEPNQVNHNRA